MINKEPTNIRMIVEDEEALYSTFSPDAEFKHPVKSYIRSKVDVSNYKNGIRLTVMSGKPLDEDRFRKAVSNWVRAEKAKHSSNEKKTLFMLSALLIFGSIMFVLSLFLVKNYQLLKYSLLPIIGSLALSKAAGIIVMDIPAIRAQRWVMREIEKSNLIIFECIPDDVCTSDEEVQDKQVR